MKSERGILENLTRRNCVSKVAEVFDILGKFTPITAATKLDLHDLVNRKLDWDDVIPDILRPAWLSHFEMIQEMKNVKYQCAILPSGAVNLEIDTIDTLVMPEDGMFCYLCAVQKKTWQVLQSTGIIKDQIST